METKEQLVTSIKGWINVDNEIARLQRELKTRREQKKQLSEDLVKTMKTNNIDCFDINGGALRYKRSVTKKPLNGKTILSLLDTYFKESDIKHEEVTKYLLDNREEKVTETLLRKIDKDKK